MSNIKLAMFLLIIIIGFSCQNNNVSDSENVTLEILNKELFHNKKYSHNNSSNQHYEDEVDRQKATNVLTWKITNSSQKNFLFILDEKSFLAYPFADYKFSLGLSVFLTNRNNEKIWGGGSDILWSGNDPATGNLLNCEPYADSIKKQRYEVMGVSDANYYWQKAYVEDSFILHSGESKTFKTVVCLPIFNEVDSRVLSSQMVTDDLNPGDVFQLKYKSDSKIITESLLPYQIEELEDNNIYIFSGKLMSNKVPLIGRE